MNGLLLAWCQDASTAVTRTDTQGGAAVFPEQRARTVVKPAPEPSRLLVV